MLRLRPAPGWEGTVDLLLGDDLEAIVFGGEPSAAVDAPLTTWPLAIGLGPISAHAAVNEICPADAAIDATRPCCASMVAMAA